MHKFEAIIKKMPDKDATFIEIPFDVEKEFGEKRVKVKAKFDGVEYRGSIVNMGLECHIIGITKSIRNQIGKCDGDRILVEVEKDVEVREVELPIDFRCELEKNELALKFYNSISYSAKRKYYQWITSAKKEETRNKRIFEAVSKLESNIKL
ncbi:YdeI/OmpD-associated family protein [Romboutsia lituseburensis]|uniref:Bacteriocin-protection, YdeI or OmpD-Associated n=1 Tax=Romboutsia lituseburensis DSM 797 TaxID=1121325 RepID=A0A1G9K6B7_9FIRM|nr:YdeI/OmpD-associated family protein [Romboutsia lituseburensis]CEH34789.1 Transcription antitermination factor NusB [Romboutsia lituseburensis]SDL45430.1 Bacteriocin-protection, YdeI or OmpD-Associated [Romboutsia lituseburensis DSM 797]